MTLQLNDLQAQFRHALIDISAPTPQDVKSYLTARPDKRFAVYRNNVYSSLIDALSAQFPVIARLLGPSKFAHAAQDYIGQHPPSSPLLMFYGAEFPQFLSAHHELQDLPYLEPVAALEWAWLMAYHASDEAPLTPDELGQIPFDKIDELIFKFHPSLSLLSSPYPFHSIWQTNKYDETVAKIELDADAQAVMIMRPQLDVVVTVLPMEQWLFMQLLAQGECLGAASEKVLNEYNAFDVQAALVMCLQANVITSYDFPAR